MKTEKNNLFLILLRLKSYLVSMIDDPEAHSGSLEMTNEYLELKYPDMKDDILALLENNKIFSDSEIAFDEKIVFRFRTMASSAENNSGLANMLNELDINTENLSKEESGQFSISQEREKRLSEILYILYKLGTQLEVLKSLEDKSDNFSLLNNEDLIRPEEEKNLNALDESASKVYYTISLLSGKYIELLANYFNFFGGRKELDVFLKALENSETIINNKYRG